MAFAPSAALAAAAARYAWQTWQRRSWPRVTGEVARVIGLAALDDHPAVWVAYRYHVAGQEYGGQTVLGRLHWDARRELAAVRHQPDALVGTAVHVYPDPLRPERHTLDPDRSTEAWLCLAFGVAWALLGAWVW